MKDDILALLENSGVRAKLRQAWLDSNPGLAGGHEEGGFILQDAAGQPEVLRWPQGEQSTIVVPDHPGGHYGGKKITASFHTHPNTGDDYLQEPGETDKLAVKSDPDFQDDFYLGELVISAGLIYLIKPTGSVSVVTPTKPYFEKGVLT